MRLDLFVAANYQTTRNRAQFWIDSGLIFVNAKTVTKASYQVSEMDTIELMDDKRVEWVSRSAVKLDDFLEMNKFQIESLRCLDIGSSTGGFTQVLLSR